MYACRGLFHVRGYTRVRLGPFVGSPAIRVCVSQTQRGNLGKRPLPGTSGKVWAIFDRFQKNGF